VFVYADTKIKGMIYNVIKDVILYHCNIASCYLLLRTLEQEPLRRRSLFNKLTLIPRHMEQPENIHHSVEFTDLIPFPSFPHNIRLE